MYREYFHFYSILFPMAGFVCGDLRLKRTACASLCDATTTTAYYEHKQEKKLKEMAVG